MEPGARLRANEGSGRIVGLDVARGLAVLGMYGAHVGLTEDFDWPRPETWLDVVNGRSSILFAVLAGVSIAIISGRRRPVAGVELLQARLRIFTRAALIFALGGLLASLGTRVAVILPAYAVLFVLALPFLRWSVERLFTLAGVLALAMPVLHLVLVPDGRLRGAPAFVDLVVTGFYPAMIWIVFVLLGMGIGRLDLTAVRVRATLLGAGVVLATIGYGLGSLLALTGGEDTELFLTVEPHSGSIFEVIGSAGFAVAIIALCLFAADALRWVLFPVAAVGSMALTAYSVQLVAIFLLGDDVFEQTDNALYIAFVLSALAGCTAWVLLIGRGPFERLLTVVSHAAARFTSTPAGSLDGEPLSKENTQQ